ncbi:outer membrane beta-barrel protein [Epilithonimonas xixisoli]|uniref:Outer membrane beta-barrel protein n=1 Tax=Epilithonimonas xixisoli TaxID=1476462 RepID=A0A4V3H290_9FLAO|nr:outer membrane beta-barrel protein [Epilithonimonas xixisoli]TDX82617.1 outer membrane beta-barrel protein [Epilithonimonas xixisoli]
MKKFWLVFIFTFLKLNAQTYSVNGKVFDENNNPLENVSVSLMKQKDSSIINFIGTSKSGSFSLKIPEQKEASFLQISGDKLKTFTRKFESIYQNENLGVIKLNKELITNIEEVQITVSPVKIKKDTIEYNASFLKVKPDSKIDELIKEIPGAEIDSDGKITVNGKSVSKIHINGKPLFDKNGKTELETIPADIIKKIQVTTSKTKEQELTGRAPITDSLTVNFEMDKKHRQGTLTNLRLGYGSNNRYDGALFFTKTKQDSRLAISAGSNNINAGLSGKTGSGTGIFRTSVVNVTYSDKFDNLDLERLNANFYERNTETYSKTARTTFLPDYKLDRNTERSDNRSYQRLGFSSNAVLKLDQFTNLIFSAGFNNNITESDANNQSSTLRDDILLNSSSGSVKQKSINNGFSQSLGITKKFKKERRTFSASVDGNFTENSGTDYNLMTTIFHQSPEENDYRNQRSISKRQNTDFSFNMKYDEPISDSAIVSTELTYKSLSLRNDRKVNDFDTESEEFSIYNSLLSNTINQDINSLNAVVGYDLNKTKFRFFFNAHLDFNANDFQSIFNSENINFKRNFVFPNYETRFTYNFSNSNSLELYNQSNFTAPTMTALNPFTDISNPLVTTQGNPDLKSTWKNTSSIYFVNRNLPKNITYSAKLKFDYTDNQISDFSFYDDTGRQFRTYANISGNKNLSWDARFSKTYKWNKNQLRISPTFFSSYAHRKGFVDGVQFTNTIYNFSPRINLRLNLKEILDVTSSASLNYNFSNYTNYRVDKTRSAQQNYAFGIVNYFLKSNLFFTNDLNVTKNNNISAGFNRTSYFWNASVNYKFYKKQMTVRFNINDVLNQRQNAIRNIGDNYIEDREDLVLRRYFMLSIMMNLSQFGGKKS